VLFIPTRGALRRPEELEAAAYEDRPEDPEDDQTPEGRRPA
jgi:hypothetical protein